MRRAGAARRAALLAIVPLLVAASDPRATSPAAAADAASGAPDLVGARGEIVELGTSARWTLTFAEPLIVPDAGGASVPGGHRDPGSRRPAVSFAYYGT